MSRGVVAGALALIALLALAVCALHAGNAVALRGVVSVGDCEVLARGREADCIARVERVEAGGGLLRVSGALMRPGETVGEVYIRVGLVAVRQEEMGDPAGGLAPEDEVILLNTQMKRRPDLAEAYACDDHCGFEAAARESALRAGTPYAIVLLDGASAKAQLLQTGCWLMLGEEQGLTWGCWSETQGEAQENE